MNAILTWWGVAVAVRSHQELATSFIGQNTLIKVVPVFVALMVWLIRVLIIGTISMAGGRLFSMVEGKSLMPRNSLHPQASLQPTRASNLPLPNRPAPAPFYPVPKPEPTYHPLGMAASPRDRVESLRK
jgi:hypothetical protein